MRFLILILCWLIAVVASGVTQQSSTRIDAFDQRFHQYLEDNWVPKIAIPLRRLGSLEAFVGLGRSLDPDEDLIDLIEETEASLNVNHPEVSQLIAEMRLVAQISLVFGEAQERVLELVEQYVSSQQPVDREFFQIIDRESHWVHSEVLQVFDVALSKKRPGQSFRSSKLRHLLYDFSIFVPAREEYHSPLLLKFVKHLTASLPQLPEAEVTALIIGFESYFIQTQMADFSEVRRQMVFEYLAMFFRDANLGVSYTDIIREMAYERAHYLLQTFSPLQYSQQQRKMFQLAQNFLMKPAFQKVRYSTSRRFSAGQTDNDVDKYLADEIFSLWGQDAEDMFYGASDNLSLGYDGLNKWLVHFLAPPSKQRIVAQSQWMSKLPGHMVVGLSNMIDNHTEAQQAWLDEQIAYMKHYLDMLFINPNYIAEDDSGSFSMLARIIIDRLAPMLMDPTLDTKNRLFVEKLLVEFVYVAANLDHQAFKEHGTFALTQLFTLLRTTHGYDRIVELARHAWQNFDWPIETQLAAYNLLTAQARFKVQSEYEVVLKNLSEDLVDRVVFVDIDIEGGHFFRDEESGYTVSDEVARRSVEPLWLGAKFRDPCEAYLTL